ncbi:hypothetical protein RSAG8_03479, partial [Rhizoctonia solani AG-8 WAC10335]
RVVLYVAMHHSRPRDHINVSCGCDIYRAIMLGSCTLSQSIALAPALVMYGMEGEESSLSLRVN